MRRVTRFDHRFVESFPKPLEPGVLYVSTRFRTAAHLCACGCETKVVTPLSPASWVLTFDGDTVSLSPSVGNGRIACRSHYFIRANAVIWARPMSDADSAAAQRHDAQTRGRYYSAAPEPRPAPASAPAPVAPATARSWWRRWRDWLG
ncbi:hypothetical protein FIV34_11615 [Luteibacter pinisoli]|uniref:Uncharacterized protein n=1 Tax=Luteibacter pinisoli TaxID=2589080 RepID=A0A4Y5Z6D1_9GAMM|nr:DUF6527 family protein [Luteibacter pinisoli]QDE39808.1 hypothetical protein FIV34_11615 [Luteibacter pinisoli]